MAVLASLVFVGCDKDEPDPEDVIASFQFEVSSENWNVKSFSPIIRKMQTASSGI